jgi:RimJ/RimL family protein N-acetyltransferase
MQPEAITLENAHVVLEPIEERHRELLRAAGADAALWKFATRNQHNVDFDDWFDARREASRKDDATFAIYDKAARAWCGSSSFIEHDAHNKRIEIGWTWYHREFWGGAVNPGAKHALFSDAFGRLELNRVQLKVDSLNERSQSAVLRLGAMREGVLRNHIVMPDGRLRHSVIFSVIREEWPHVKARLVERLSA